VEVLLEDRDLAVDLTLGDVLHIALLDNVHDRRIEISLRVTRSASPPTPSRAR